MNNSGFEPYKNLFGYTLDELKGEMVASGFKPYNAEQVFEWIYQKLETDFGNMTNLSKRLRSELAANFSLCSLEIHSRHESTDGTIKYLLRLTDGFLIETVLIRHDYGNSVCVTSQVGCNMGCAFCASGLKKKQRDLSLEELTGQLYRIILDQHIRITHVVVMGTGEPFDNYDNVIRFIRTINVDKGLAIGQRHITVSTCGIVPMIYRYAHEPIRSNLAISLHAPNDELRNRLMPINRAYPLTKLIPACEYYFARTSRRLTFEYILLKDVNDSLEMADELAKLLGGLNCYVNLIRYNPVSEFAFRQTDHEHASRFLDRLIKSGIVATLRKEQGADIAAACGQLRLKNGD